MKFYEDAKLKAGFWLRERKEKQAEREAQKQESADPAGVTVPLWLVNAAKFAAWVATISLMYFLWLYTLDIARDRAGAMHITHAGTWIGNVEFWFPYIAGFALIAFGIPYVAKIAIPTFMSLSWRGNFWPKLWALVIAVAVSLVVIAGTFTVQGDTIMERDRDAAVAVEGVEQESAVLASRIADTRAELDDMVNNASVYVRTAASMSPAAYDVFVEQRRDDWQYQRLLSYRATSVDAERLRNEITTLRDQQARQTTVASVQGEVTTERTGWIADTLGWLEGVRAILLSLVMDIVALMMPWIALRLEQARNRQMGLSESAFRSRWDMVEDQRAAGNVVHEMQRRSAQDVVDAMIEGGADPRFAADMARSAMRSDTRKTTLRDAATDETIIDRDGDLATIVREHTRKKKDKDGRPIKIMVPAPPPPPDETGVAYDSGNRIGVSPNAEQGEETHPEQEQQDIVASGEEIAPSAGDGAESPVAAPLASDNAVDHSEPSILELPEAPEEDDLEASAPVEDEVIEHEQSGADTENHAEENQPETERGFEDDSETGAQTESPEREEPETDERNLLANVAAE